MKMRNTPLVLYQMEILEVVNHMVYALGLFLTKMLALYLIMTDIIKAKTASCMDKQLTRFAHGALISRRAFTSETVNIFSAVTILTWATVACL